MSVMSYECITCASQLCFYFSSGTALHGIGGGAQSTTFFYFDTYTCITYSVQKCQIIIVLKVIITAPPRWAPVHCRVVQIHHVRHVREIGIRTHVNPRVRIREKERERMSVCVCVCSSIGT